MDGAAPDVIEAAIAAIRQADLRHLASPAWMEHEFLPRLGLSDVLPGFYPPLLRQFCGRGVQSFQQPNQFARYLCHLAQCRVTSYLEVGVWQGGTFIITVEYLSRFNKLSRAMAVDVAIKPQMRDYARINGKVALVEGDSKTDAVRHVVRQGWWDLALVDGDHSEEGCFSDYQMVRDVAGMIALHDVCSDLCPAVTAVWQRLTGVYPRRCVHEFSDQYAEVLQATGQRTMGIGLIDLNLGGGPAIK